MNRREELAARLARVHERIAAACSEVGRDPGEVGLVVVTKFFPASDVRLLVELGVPAVGENRHQEAEQKVRDCAGVPVRWHFIGGLQSNKAAAVARYADVVESVDRAKLVRRLDEGAASRAAPVDCLLQVSLDPPGVQGRAGAAPSDLPQLAAAVSAAEHLRLCGLMAVAPLEVEARVAFDRLAEIRAAFVARHPAATTLSAGMSGDLEHAVRVGATHVRVGSAILGSRPQVK